MQNNLEGSVPPTDRTAQKTALLPADPLGKRFCHWFNFGFKHIYSQGGRWLTEKRYPIQPRNIWSTYQDPNTIIGLRFGKLTNYLVIDIDRESQYHPLKDLNQYRRIPNTLEEHLGLNRYILIQSSWSEGVHLYYFLPKPVPSIQLACGVKHILAKEGITIESGQVESFPNLKTYCKGKPTNYNGCRLPLQPGTGSYMITDDFNFISSDISYFLNWADRVAASQDIEVLESVCAKSYQEHKRSSRSQPMDSTKAQKWKQDLEERIAPGWTGTGQTNELLKDIAQYGVVFQALTGDRLIAYVHETAINLPGYQEYCQHQHEIRHRCAERARNADGYWVPYCGYPPRTCTYAELFNNNQTDEPTANNIVPINSNQERQEQARSRIKQAVAHLEENHALPAKATPRSSRIIETIKAMTGVSCSNATLHKPDNLPLWHPKHYPTPSGCTTPSYEPPETASTTVSSGIESPSASASNPTVQTTKVVQLDLKTPKALPEEDLNDIHPKNTDPAHMKVCRAATLAPPSEYVALGVGVILGVQGLDLATLDFHACPGFDLLPSPALTNFERETFKIQFHVETLPNASPTISAPSAVFPQVSKFSSSEVLADFSSVVLETGITFSQLSRTRTRFSVDCSNLFLQDFSTDPLDLTLLPAINSLTYNYSLWDKIPAHALSEDKLNLSFVGLISSAEEALGEEILSNPMPPLDSISKPFPAIPVLVDRMVVCLSLCETWEAVEAEIEAFRAEFPAVMRYHNQPADWESFHAQVWQSLPPDQVQRLDTLLIEYLDHKIRL